MREKLARFAESHHSEFRFLSQRAFRNPSGKSMRKFRTVLSRMDFLFWFAAAELKKSLRPLHNLSESVKTLCAVDGALKRAEALSLSVPSLVNSRKRCRRDIRQILLPKNQKAISAKISGLIQAIREGKGLKSREKIAELRTELSRWKRKDLTPKRDLARLEKSVARARFLLEANERSVDNLRTLLKSLHRSEEFRTLSLSQPEEKRIKLGHRDSLEEIGSELDATLKSVRKKLKGI